MVDGVCYAINSSTQIYVYPDLNCIEGQAVPAATNTNREIWNLDEVTKKFVKYQTGTTSVNTGTSSTKVIGHLWSSPSWFQQLEPSSLLLPAVIVVLCFFKLIINMFMGVRR